MHAMSRGWRGAAAIVSALALMFMGAQAASAAAYEDSRCDFTGDNIPDLVTRDSGGRLYIYPGNTGKGLSPRIVLGTGWNAFTAIIAPGDWTGDGKNDLIVRDSTGTLWVYFGTEDSWGFGPRFKIGSGWNSMNAIVALGDVNGDTFADIGARTTTGYFYVYYGDGSVDTDTPTVSSDWGWTGTRKYFGGGFNAYTAMVGVGDFNGAGGADMVVRTSNGYLHLIAGDGLADPSFAAPVRIGTGWNGMTALVGPGDSDADGYTDIIARDGATGKLYRYPGDGMGGFKSRVLIGTSGWNAFTAIVG